MLKKLAKLSLLATALSMGAGQAQAARGIDFPTALITKTFSGSGVIEVTSSDGQTWTDIRKTKLEFPVKIDITVPEGHVVGYKVRLGNISLKHELFTPFKPPHFHQSMLLKGMTSDYSKPFRDTIIGMCNATLSGGKRIDESVNLTYDTELSLTAWTANASGESNTPMVRTTQTSIPVKCIGKPKAGPYAGSNDIGFDHGKMKVKGIKLFLTTYSHANSQPNPGTKCKKVKLLVRLNASKKGPVKFKLWKKVGNDPMTSKVIDAWASHDGNGFFKAEYSEWISVSKTTYLQAKAEEMVNPIGLSTPWEDITLHCTGAGGGGLTTQNPNPVNPDDIPQGQTLKGDFGFVDYGSPKCPRTGKALVTFRSPKSDNIHWSLDCKFSSKSGVLPTQPHPDGGFMAATLVPIDVSTTMDESCTLRTVAPYNPKDHVTKDHLFQCITPSGHSGTSDLAPETRPNSDAPRNPGKIVIDPPRTPDKADVVPPRYPSNGQLDATIVTGTKATCAGGVVTKRGCKCHKRTHMPVKAGKKAWRCVPKVVIDPVRPDKDKTGSTAGRGGRKVKIAIPPKRKLKRKTPARRTVGKRKKNRAMRLR